jgi:hypothetical protein
MSVVQFGRASSTGVRYDAADDERVSFLRGFRLCARL